MWVKCAAFLLSVAIPVILLYGNFHIYNHFGLPGLQTSITSLSAFSAMPADLSISQFLSILFLLKLLAIMSILFLLIIIDTIAALGTSNLLTARGNGCTIAAASDGISISGCMQSISTAMQRQFPKSRKLAAGSLFSWCLYCFMPHRLSLCVETLLITEKGSVLF